MDGARTNLGLYEVLKEDLRAAQKKAGQANVLGMLVGLTSAGFSAVFLHRVAAAASKKGVIGRIGCFLLRRVNLMLNGCDISPGAVMGEGFTMPHPMGIVLGDVTIGRHVTVLQRTTLGLKYSLTDDFSDRANYPRVGNNRFHFGGCCCGGGCEDWQWSLDWP